MPLRKKAFWERAGAHRLTIGPCAMPNVARCDFCDEGRLAVFALTMRRGTRTYNAIACISCGGEIVPLPAPPPAPEGT